MITEDIIYNADIRLNKARAAMRNGNDGEATKHLGILYYFLKDHFESKARDKCEFGESSKPS